MTSITPHNYKKIPNSVYFCGLSLYKISDIKWIDCKKLVSSQEWIDLEKAKIMKDMHDLREVAGIAVEIDDFIYVMDGHHRAYAAELRGDKRVKLRLVDLNKFLSENVERHKGKSKINLDDIKASDLEESGLL